MLIRWRYRSPQGYGKLGCYQRMILIVRDEVVQRIKVNLVHQEKPDLSVLLLPRLDRHMPDLFNKKIL